MCHFQVKAVKNQYASSIPFLLYYGDPYVHEFQMVKWQHRRGLLNPWWILSGQKQDFFLLSFWDFCIQSSLAWPVQKLVAQVGNCRHKNLEYVLLTI